LSPDKIPSYQQNEEEKSMDAQAHATVDNSISSLLAAISAISLENHPTPPRNGARKGPHYKALGVPSDFVKQLIVHIDGVANDIESFINDFERQREHNQVDLKYARDDDERKRIDEESAQIIAEKPFRATLNAKKRELDFLQMLMGRELEQQFPDIASASGGATHQLIIDDDWNLGFNDHSNLLREAVGGSESDLFADGEERMPAFMAGLDGLMPFGDPFDPFGFGDDEMAAFLGLPRFEDAFGSHGSATIRPTPQGFELISAKVLGPDGRMRPISIDELPPEIAAVLGIKQSAPAPRSHAQRASIDGIERVLASVAESFRRQHRPGQ
jgi:hypothetical protein